MSPRDWSQRFGPWLVVPAAFLAIVSFAGALVYGFAQQQHINRKLCAQTVANRDAVRSTWTAARVLVVKGLTDPNQVERTNEFFDRILRPIPALECVDNRPIRKGSAS